MAEKGFHHCDWQRSTQKKKATVSTRGCSRIIYIIVGGGGGGAGKKGQGRRGRTHSTQFIYGYMASDIC